MKLVNTGFVNIFGKFCKSFLRFEILHIFESFLTIESVEKCKKNVQVLKSTRKYVIVQESMQKYKKVC